MNPTHEFTIGEFSLMTRLTVKTLRYYHEEGLVLPCRVADNGYRFYDGRALDRAVLVSRLKEWDFNIKEIREALDRYDHGGDLGSLVDHKAKEIATKARHYTQLQNQLEVFQKSLKEETIMNVKPMEILEKTLPETLVVSLRYRGRYDQIGTAFGRLFKTFGRYSAGAPFALYHDAEYRDEDADIEACLPLRKEFTVAGFETKRLAGGPALCLVYKGPYDAIGAGYRALTEALQSRGLQAQVPCREVYLKGPGLIFPRNPANFLTEIQMVLG